MYKPNTVPPPALPHSHPLSLLGLFPFIVMFQTLTEFLYHEIFADIYVPYINMGMFLVWAGLA
jgi:hypothetical protein